MKQERKGNLVPTWLLSSHDPIVRHQRKVKHLEHALRHRHLAQYGCSDALFNHGLRKLRHAYTRKVNVSNDNASNTQQAASM